MAVKLTKDKVIDDMIMLYKKGWSPEEITLAFIGINKNRKQVEKIVMRAIKPLFN